MQITFLTRTCPPVRLFYTFRKYSLTLCNGVFAIKACSRRTLPVLFRYIDHNVTATARSAGVCHKKNLRGVACVSAAY